MAATGDCRQQVNIGDGRRQYDQYEDSHTNSTTFDFRMHFSELSPGGKSLNVANMTYRTTAGKLSTEGIDFTPSFTYGGFQFVQLTVSRMAAVMPTPT